MSKDLNMLNLPNPLFSRKINIWTEVLNAITHGLGVVLGIVALILLIGKTSSTIEVVAYVIYAVSIMLLFLASTLYHSFSFTKARNIFRVIDHSSIFLLIAGTYSPYLLLGIRNTKAYIFTGFIWTIALIGICLKVFMFERSKKISTILYLAMGWAIILIFHDLITSVSRQSLALLVAGGLAYSFGVIFYRQKKLIFSHVYWHLAVLAGAVLMFLSIYLYL